MEDLDYIQKLKLEAIKKLDLEFKAKKYPIYWSYDKGIVILDGLPDEIGLENWPERTPKLGANFNKQLSYGLGGQRLFKIKDGKLTIHNMKNTGFLGKMKTEKRYEPVIDATIISIEKGKYTPKGLVSSEKNVLYITFEKIVCIPPTTTTVTTRCYPSEYINITKRKSENIYIEVKKYSAEWHDTTLNNDEPGESIDTNLDKSSSSKQKKPTMSIIFENRLKSKNNHLLTIFDNFRKLGGNVYRLNFLEPITGETILNSIDRVQTDEVTNSLNENLGNMSQPDAITGETILNSIDRVQPDEVTNSLNENLGKMSPEEIQLKKKNIKYRILRTRIASMGLKLLIITAIVFLIIKAPFVFLPPAAAKEAVLLLTGVSCTGLLIAFEGLSFDGIWRMINKSSIGPDNRYISFTNLSKGGIGMSLYKYNEGKHLYIDNAKVLNIVYEAKGQGDERIISRFVVTLEKSKCPFDSVTSKRCIGSTAGGYKHKQSRKKRKHKLNRKKRTNIKKSRGRRRVRKRTRRR